MIGSRPRTHAPSPWDHFLSRRRLCVGALAWAPLLVGCVTTAQRGTIGAILLRKADGRVFVEEVPAHLAAAQAGIRPGDELLLVEGQDVRRLSDEELSRVLGGAVGDSVNLTLTRGDRVVRVQVERSQAERYRLE